MRRKWLILTVCAALALVALLVWLGVEDARQAALLDAREREAAERVEEAFARGNRLARDGAPAAEVEQAYEEDKGAWEEMQTLRTERWRRQQSWQARLVREVRRRTGW